MRRPEMYTPRYFRLYRGVEQALPVLKSFAETNGYTGAENNRDIYQMRLKFCEHFGLGNSNIIIGSKEVRAGFDVLFDDNPYVIDHWVKSVTPTKIFMISQPYNRHLNLQQLGWTDKVIRCNNFIDAVKKCRDIFAK